MSDFKSFCEETGRDWKSYSNLYLFEEYADWSTNEIRMKLEDVKREGREEALAEWRAADETPRKSADSPDDIRAQGWRVAVHNDYRLSGEVYTFWLFTRGNQAIKGEGHTDAEALNKIRTLLAATPSEPMLSKDDVEAILCGQRGDVEDVNGDYDTAKMTDVINRVLDSSGDRKGQGLVKPQYLTTAQFEELKAAVIASDSRERELADKLGEDIPELLTLFEKFVLAKEAVCCDPLHPVDQKYKDVWLPKTNRGHELLEIVRAALAIYDAARGGK